MRTQHEGTTTTTGVSANQPTLKGQPQNELDQKIEQKFLFQNSYSPIKTFFLGHHHIQHNNTQHNDTQHN